MTVVAPIRHIPVRRAATLLGVHENTLRNWADRGIIRMIQLPGSGFRRVPIAEVERLQAEMWRDMPEPTWQGYAATAPGVTADEEEYEPLP